MQTYTVSCYVIMEFYVLFIVREKKSFALIVDFFLSNITDRCPYKQHAMYRTRAIINRSLVLTALH